MSRYIKSNDCTANCESYARMHNGGSRACDCNQYMHDKTNNYWRKFKQKVAIPIANFSFICVYLCDLYYTLDIKNLKLIFFYLLYSEYFLLYNLNYTSKSAT